MTNQADDAKQAVELAARRAAEAAASAPWFAFLAAKGCGSDTFRRIESLGGYAKARELFKAVSA